LKKLFKMIHWDVLIVVFLIIFWVCSAAFGAESWDKTEKGLMALAVSAYAIDTLQTSYIISDDSYDEINPIISNGVDLTGKSFIPLYFIGVIALEYWIADHLSHKNRKIFLGIVTALEIGVISRNAYIGVGLKY
jgi:hypothetical protein